MGNREALIDGAMRCLLDKGYARTTARDIATASGVSLAAIGYHFGSKDALLDEALLQATIAWGDRLEAAIAADVDPDLDRYERFEAVWARVIDLFEDNRGFWKASFEMVNHVDSAPKLHRAIADAQEDARRGLAHVFTGMDEADPRAPVLGALYQSVLSGLMALMLVDATSAPTARELADALRLATSA